MVTTEAYREAAQRLDEFATLGPGWDTYDARPIAPRAIDEARQLLVAVARQFDDRAPIAQPFFVSPLPYGGVHIEWRHRDSAIEIEIGPDGAFGYLLMIGEGESRTFEEKDRVSADVALGLIINLFHGE